MEKICDEKDCFGCAACIDKCPVSCIHFEQNSIGHFIPKIDTTQCIDCKSCVMVCPANHVPERKMPHTVYAAWRKDESLRIQSSSGGIATALSEHTIKQGGVVYGAAFVPGFKFKHTRCTSLDDLNAIRGSKYVQSDMRDIYKQMAIDLKNGVKVLYIGTPCQVVGVKNTFQDKYDNLTTIDLVCHGVPSNAMLIDSLPHDVLFQEADRVDFRENNKFLFSIKKEHNILLSRPLSKDFYYKGFFTGLFYRDSCYSCPFAQAARVGDLTLGDFWGINRAMIPIDPQTGISLCLVNSKSGACLYNQIQSEIDAIPRPYEEALKHNEQLRKPKTLSFRGRIFRYFYPKIGFKWSIRLSIPEIVIKSCFKSYYK